MGGRVSTHKSISGMESNAPKKVGCKRLRRMKKLEEPYFAEESVTKNWPAASGQKGTKTTRL